MSFGPFKLTFTQASADYLQAAYTKANIILEYGSGGSTLYGTQQGKTVITVESSREWLDNLTQTHKKLGHSGELIPQWADIGQTIQWGHPADESRWKQWSGYPTKPWSFCLKQGLIPDLVLVDGRFRVACFLAAAAYCKQPTLLLFDDFASRDYYHCVKQLVTPTEIVDNRMAVFHLQPGKVSAEQLANHIPYFYDPR